MFENAAQVIRYALAGKATLTLVSLRTGVRYTYEIKKGRGGRKAPWFVSVLTGADNQTDYEFAGSIFSEGSATGGPSVYRHGGKSQLSPLAPSVRAFAWAWSAFLAGGIPDALEVYHEGRCGRCGRKLTVPESIDSGLGPDCATRE